MAILTGKEPRAAAVKALPRRPRSKNWPAFSGGLIRALTKERGPVWDARPELYFKAFLLREAGRFGAIANSFSSLYLWRQDGVYRDGLVSGGYKIVTDARRSRRALRSM